MIARRTVPHACREFPAPAHVKRRLLRSTPHPDVGAPQSIPSTVSEMFGQLTAVGTEGLPTDRRVRRGHRDGVRALPTTERGTMILVGAVLLALGLIFNI